MTRPKDSTKQSTQSYIGMQTSDEAMVAVKRILSSPPVLVGVGLGVAISMGIDLLQGKAYCAVAKQDVFHVDSIQIGPLAGRWEGASIDILCVLGPGKVTDTLQVKSSADN